MKLPDLTFIPAKLEPINTKVSPKPKRIRISTNSIDALRKIKISGIAIIHMHPTYGPILCFYWEDNDPVIKKFLENPVLVADATLLARYAEIIKLRKTRRWIVTSPFIILSRKSNQNTIKNQYFVFIISPRIDGYLKRKKIAEKLAKKFEQIQELNEKIVAEILDNIIEELSPR